MPRKFKYGKGFVFHTILLTADSRDAQTDPTLAAGDVKISKDDGALNNLNTLPDSTNADTNVLVTVSDTEAQCDQIIIRFVDAAGAEWEEQTHTFERELLNEGREEIKVPAGFCEAWGVTSAQITRANYPDYGVMYTDNGAAGATQYDFDPALLIGAIIKNDLLTRPWDYSIIGGYFYTKSTGVTTKVFGKALDSAFGVTEGGTTTISDLWSPTVESARTYDGWTFIINDTKMPYAQSGDPMSMYVNPSELELDKISDRVIQKLAKLTIDATGPGGNAVSVTGGANSHGMKVDGQGAGQDIYAPDSNLGINVTSVGGSLVTNSNGVTVTTGTPTGTYTNTFNADGSYHEIDDIGNEVDVTYDFNVGGNGTPTGFTFVGFLNAVTDDIVVQAMNWGTGFETIGVIDGQASTTINIEKFFTLFARHVGTGANLGDIQIRFYKTGGSASLSLNSDQLYVTYSASSNSVGYQNSSVWIDTISGVAGTEAYVNGVADNPTLSEADAETLMTAVNLKTLTVLPGSTIDLSNFTAGFMDGKILTGARWTLVGAGQSLSGSTVEGASVSGIITGAIPPKFIDCQIGAVTIPPCTISKSAWTGTWTIGSSGDFFFDQCYSGIAGTARPHIDMQLAVGATNVSIRHHSGGVEVENMTALDSMSLEGNGQLYINANCTGGIIAKRGAFTFTDDASGVVTVVEDAPQEFIRAMFKGDYDLNTPGLGDITFYNLGGRTGGVSAGVVHVTTTLRNNVS